MTEYLLAPIRIGSMTVHNRIVMAPMAVGLVGDDGAANEALIAYYEERARGGAGLVVTEGVAFVAPDDADPRRLGLFGDALLEPFRELTDRVHEHGAKIAVQLVPPAVESAARVLTPAALATLTVQLGDAVERARATGFDAVEIQAGHATLAADFLSRTRNQRDDAYGGSAEHRARLLAEWIAEAKRRWGSDVPVWVRLDAFEHDTPGGTTFDDCQTHARLAVEAGADAIHLSAWAEPASVDAIAHGAVPADEAPLAALSGKLTRDLAVPVIAVGRIGPEVGDEMIAYRKADLVAMGRQLLADPATPRKLAEARSAEIRPCINCYGCVAVPASDGPARCVVNPTLGREAELATVERSPAARPRHVVIVGGGPAGLEAARVAAARGHRVTLWEAAERLGGGLRLAAVIGEPIRPLLRWYEHELERFEVDVRTGTSADVARIAAVEADAVVIATGGRRVRPDIAGIDSRRVLDLDEFHDALTGRAGRSLGDRVGLAARLALALGRRAGLVDDPAHVARLSERFLAVGDHVVVVGGGAAAVLLADFLAERGRTVTVVTTEPSFAPDMAPVRRALVLGRLRDRGVELVAGVSGPLTVSADGVVLAAAPEPESALADDLRAAGLDPIVIGDAGGSGDLGAAILAGFETAIAL